MTAAAPFPYLGPDFTEARAMLNRAISEGLSHARAAVLANVASFRDCWASRWRLAQQVGVSLRTVQRALTQGHEIGLIGKARARKGEIMPGSPKTKEHPDGVPQTCGYSHRWTVGRGQAVAEALAAVAAARVRRLLRQEKRAGAGVAPPPPGAPKPQQEPRRRYTAAELDAELARRAPVDEPDAEPPEKPPD
jgi:hypothetical protein